MKPIVRSRLKLLTAITGVGLALAFSANAQLLHRYDFSVDGSDSVGTAHGTLVNTATITGGALVTAGGNGAVNGNWNAGGPRLTLPASAVAGITGAFSIEDWFTCTTGWPKYDTLYSFSDNTIDNYILAAPVRGYSPWPSGIGIIGGGGVTRAQTNVWDLVLNGIYLDQGGPHQTVLTYDGTTFKYYVDGVLANYAGLPSTAVDPGFNLSSLTYIGLNGGSPYNDPTLTGSTWDFRIYGQALTADQVASLYSLGSDAGNASILQVIPEPSTVTLALTGLIAMIWGWRRKSC